MKNRTLGAIRAIALCAAVILPLAGLPALADPSLEQGWESPPTEARLRAYWWWLNGCVTKASITRDLEEMKAKGFGGALICDAGGAEQDGNDKVPHGPTFFTPEWRELYKHALREADRLGLEMSLNIQSGWNLGGPMVSADDAAKKLVFSEARIKGPGGAEHALPEPKHSKPYYKDLFIVAFPIKAGREAQDKDALTLSASSEMNGHSVSALGDGNPDTFWVTDSSKPGDGPTRKQPAWIQFTFGAPVSIDQLTLRDRPGYGPTECELQASEDGKTFKTVQAFSAKDKAATEVKVPATPGRAFRLMIYGSRDPKFPNQPRNVQIAELSLGGQGKSWPAGSSGSRRPIQNWQEKAVHKALHFSAPDTTPLLRDLPPQPGEEDTAVSAVVDLTAKLSKDGVLKWSAPAGEWQALRFGCTIGDHSNVSTSSDGWKGYALDVLDAGAFQRYWDAVVEPLILDAGKLAGTTLKYLHTDSWEVEAVNWTPSLREEFKKRRGYDMLPYAPALAGKIVDSRTATNRFLHDFRRTIGDLAIAHHYKPFRDGAHKHNLQIHPESGGPHAVPIDAQQCLGYDDAPMSEFWAWSWRHRVGDPNRFFVKQPASAAHTYGKRLVLAEGFTTIGPHWQETIWDNLKPSFDKACCEGLNLLVWHAFVNSPEEQGLPGIQYFAGTHMNPNVTWWPKSGPFLSYLNRCQWMLQQGTFVADVCWYYGDHVPNFAQLRASDPAKLGAGYDYDVITEEAILARLDVRDGRIVLPDGASYAMLALPDRPAISLAVLRKVRDLAQRGATIVGARPVEATGLAGFPKTDEEVRRIADELWGAPSPAATGAATLPSAATRPVGKGRVLSGVTGREALAAIGIKPDFEFTGGDPEKTAVNYIHRRTGDADIYFIANFNPREEQLTCTFRTGGKAPELWDAVSGMRRFATDYRQSDGRTTIPLALAPCGSVFIVFRAPAADHAATGQKNDPAFAPRHTLDEAWSVHFDPKLGGPGDVAFDKLVSWTERPEPGVRFYSGTATYRKTFDLPAELTDKPGMRLFLDLGRLRELAEVKLNGKSMGIIWSPPFRVDVTGVLKARGNELEIDVVNFWPNRIIGDDSLPPEKRITRTNIRKLTKSTPLIESGLFGPVQILEQVPQPR